MILCFFISTLAIAEQKQLLDLTRQYLYPVIEKMPFESTLKKNDFCKDINSEKIWTTMWAQTFTIYTYNAKSAQDVAGVGNKCPINPYQNRQEKNSLPANINFIKAEQVFKTIHDEFLRECFSNGSALQLEFLNASNEIAKHMNCKDFEDIASELLRETRAFEANR